MKWTTPTTLINTVVVASLIVTFIPINVHATGYKKWLNVYFTRHAEKKTVTEDTGSAANIYKSEYIIDENDEGKVVFIDTGETVEEPLGNLFDEVCGENKCAEELSDLGLERAELLADWLKRYGIASKLDAIYATHKKRTQQTLEPTAISTGLTVEQLPKFWNGVVATELNPEKTTPSECATLKAIANAHAAGFDTILVAGHSGTLYDIMGDGNENCDGLGLDITDNDRFPKDNENKVRDYGDIWKIVISPYNVAYFVYRINLQPKKLSLVNYAN